ncbi:hypothetical protein [Nannocystis bainbridge]|uniref:Rubrerythrin n=1 Tax=Nannocystis bainbridge TaxID=2995303 RepID=A0ABT5EAB3_9BACT|nr:hypothetical protein [Nannocystis bainbridge]MDC0722796.1 hypothetical protein [Nannocystis bainbridge]
MNEDKRNQEPLSDLAYDWVTIVQHKSEALRAYEQYIHDAEQANSPECVELLREIYEQDARHIEQASRHLVEVLRHGSMGGRREAGQASSQGGRAGMSQGQGGRAGAGQGSMSGNQGETGRGGTSQAASQGSGSMSQGEGGQGRMSQTRSQGMGEPNRMGQTGVGGGTSQSDMGGRANKSLQDETDEGSAGRRTPRSS